MVKWHESIKLKIALPIFCVSILIALVFFLFSASISISNAFHVESLNSEKALARINTTIERELRHLGNYTNDWAYWDDTYDYLGNGSESFEESNLSAETLKFAKLDFMIFMNISGEVVWAMHSVPSSEGAFIEGLPTSEDRWDGAFIKALSESGDGLDGFTLTSFGLAYFSARSVYTSQREGLANGWVITGRYYNSKREELLREQTQQHIVFAPQNLSVTLGELDNSEHEGRSGIFALHVVEGITIYDYSGKKLGTLKVSIFRHEYLDAVYLLSFAFCGLLIIAFACSFVAYRRVLSVVVTPLKELISSMERLDCYFGAEPSIERGGRDEISLLYQKYRALTGNLINIQNELKERSDDLEVKAQVDPLTGLSNRRHLGYILSDANRNGFLKIHGHKLLIMLDIDHFKQINDTWGHLSGDMVLKELALRLRRVVRKEDHVVRVGGEEFLIASTCSSSDICLSLIERVMCSVRSSPFKIADNHSVDVTISIGFTIMPIADNDEFNLALGVADKALYEAKGSGRDCWVGYGMQESADYSYTLYGNVDELVTSNLLYRTTSTAR
ncbi:diguanylate cyclase [Vibrio sp. D431a]|uniref:sensor domain-containing diguanylate cyclase n=1 Tax=Vibrio sp. D431a TaxID=2837388 RepID=UPI0025554AFC|nr:diguanylate cyclase [Vibrio sp. D431a]